MKCPNCGNENKDTALFCVSCGAKLEAPAEAVEEAASAAAEPVAEAVAEEAAPVEEAAENVAPAAEEVAEDVAPAAEEAAAEEDFSAMGWFKKFFGKNKKYATIGIIIAACFAVGIITGFTCGAISNANNNYKTPIENMANYVQDMYCGDFKNTGDYVNICKDEAQEIYDILEDEYDFTEYELKISLKFKDKEKLDKDDLEDFQDEVDEFADDLDDLIDDLEDMDSDELGEFADYLEISKKKAKQLIKDAKAMYKTFKNAKVTKGYEVKVRYSYSGDFSENFDNETKEFNVYKVAGRWISDADISAINAMLEAIDAAI